MHGDCSTRAKDCSTRAKRTQFFFEFLQAIEIIKKTLTRPSLSGIGTHLGKENEMTGLTTLYLT